MSLPFLRVKNIKKSFGNKVVLGDVSFELNEGARAGLVGFNGTGKTTLAEILTGALDFEAGTIDTFGRHLKIGYLHQSVDYTVNDFTQMMSSEDVYEHTSQLGLQKANHWNQEKLHHLSGGEKLKLALANVWASDPDFLILDEPTNHLDLDGVKWLVEQLEAFRGTAIIISHDRYFLDRTVSCVLELEAGKVQVYDGNYTAYRDEKKRQHEIQLRHYESQQRYKEKVENQMAQYKEWAAKGHRDSTKQGGSSSESRQMGLKEFHRAKAKKTEARVKSKLKRLTLQMSKTGVEKPKDEASVFFQFQNGEKRGKRIVEAKKLSKEFDGVTLFQDTDFYVKHGERVGLLGRNGSGKTTLIRMMLGEQNASCGELWRSPTLKVAYLSQDVGDLDPEKTTIEALGLENRDEILRARTMLANLGLDESKIRQKVSSLSLGERTRVKLTGMLLSDYDMLILDEPTNHLDLPSREQLEETLSQYNGTLLVVSHDTYFMEKLCDKLLAIEDGVIRRHEMGLQEYEERKNKSAVKGVSEESIEEQLMVLDTKLNAVLGELCMIEKDNPRFVELDGEFLALSRAKRELVERKAK
ncbi:ribosomal protection-like ABC-F family protein [Fictibacillus aquaticus]|uniref:ABC transporter ATP-binding protein n=1 Tax=Fictibacillus aquaticus TaxID=2021314 RepID=A0A235F5Q7_9BACL|nr:ABC-F type ribosomal protection protein [Fictibacillus aquaticus]OYD56611.1 ABC transporter ATP-binding protein [Fictibacillus aquaticus]